MKIMFFSILGFFLVSLIPSIIFNNPKFSLLGIVVGIVIGFIATFGSLK